MYKHTTFTTDHSVKMEILSLNDMTTEVVLLEV